jgi:protein-tyrosine phosphatase
MYWSKLKNPPSPIIPGLWLGNLFNGEDLIQNNTLGIEFVLDVSAMPSYPRNQYVEYLSVPFLDGHEIPEDALRTCLGALNKYHGLKKKNTLVHCAAGISRSATIVASYLFTMYKKELSQRMGVREEDLTLEQAIMVVRACRPIVLPHGNVVVSAKKHLKVWPYDGSMQ